MEEISQIVFTRQAMLSAWLKQEGITQASIAQALEISRWIRAQSLSSWRHSQLVSFGIPVNLLPPVVDKAPGPKRTNFPVQRGELQA